MRVLGLFSASATPLAVAPSCQILRQPVVGRTVTLDTKHKALRFAHIAIAILNGL